MPRAIPLTLLFLALLAPLAAPADPPTHDLSGPAQVLIETSTPLLDTVTPLRFGETELLLVPEVDAKGRVSGFAVADGRLLELGGKVAGKGNALKASLKAVGLVDGKPNETHQAKGLSDGGALQLSVSSKDKAAGSKAKGVAAEPIALDARLGRVLAQFDLVQDAKGKLTGTGCVDTRDLRVLLTKVSGRLKAVEEGVDAAKFKGSGPGAVVGLDGLITDGVFAGDASGKVGSIRFKQVAVSFPVAKTSAYAYAFGSATLETTLAPDGTLAEAQELVTTTGWRIDLAEGTRVTTRDGTPVGGAVVLGFAAVAKGRTVGCVIGTLDVSVRLVGAELGAPERLPCVFEPPLELSPPEGAFLGDLLGLPATSSNYEDTVGASPGVSVGGLGAGTFGSIASSTDVDGIDLHDFGSGSFSITGTGGHDFLEPDLADEPPEDTSNTTELILPGPHGEDWPELKRVLVSDADSGFILGFFLDSLSGTSLTPGDSAPISDPSGSGLAEVSLVPDGDARIVRVSGPYSNRLKLTAVFCNEDGSDETLTSDPGMGGEEIVGELYAGPITVTVDFKGDTITGLLINMLNLKAVLGPEGSVRLQFMRALSPALTRATLQVRGFQGATSLLGDAFDADFDCTAGPRTLHCVQDCPEPILIVGDVTDFGLRRIDFETLADTPVVDLDGRPEQLVVDRDGRRTIVAVGSQFVCVDNQLQRVIARAKLKGDAPQLALARNGLVLYVVSSSKKGGRLAAYSLVTKQLLWTLPGYGPEFLGSLTVTPGEAAFVSPFEDRLYGADLLRRRQLPIWEVGFPQAAAYSPDGTKLAITRSQANTIAFYDRLGTLLGQAATGGFPLRPAWTPGNEAVVIPEFNGDALRYVDAFDFSTFVILDELDGANSVHLDGDVDAQDYRIFGAAFEDSSLFAGEFNGDAVVDDNDFLVWQQAKGFTPGVVGGTP